MAIKRHFARKLSPVILLIGAFVMRDMSGEANNQIGLSA